MMGEALAHDHNVPRSLEVLPYRGKEKGTPMGRVGLFVTVTSRLVRLGHQHGFLGKGASA